MNPSQTRKHSPPVFTEKDYQSDNGMLTKIWGPLIWTYLHLMSFNYPVQPTSEQKKHYRDFVLSLQHTLPCGKCRKNLKRNLAKHPLLMKHMESRETFSKYLYHLHRIVNKMLHKKNDLTYEQVKERFEMFRARCLTDPKTGEPSEPVKAITPGAALPENGCIDPVYGIKSKTVLKIVPQTVKCPSMIIDSKCISRKAIAACQRKTRKHTNHNT